MDDIVKQALLKWPNVPHCYGWLALDARGNWRMRNEQAQALNLPGDKIVHSALLGFINRNYTHDEQGHWYFQNGPQRVYVNLDATPHIARTDPQQGFVLHTGTAMPAVESAWCTENGELILQGGEVLAQVDDRDLAQCMPHFTIGDKTVDDAQLLAWLAGNEKAALGWKHAGREFPVSRIKCADLERRFGFVRLPSAG